MVNLKGEGGEIQGAGISDKKCKRNKYHPKKIYIPNLSESDNGIVFKSEGRGRNSGGGSESDNNGTDK